jgi:hypothetical protein
MKEADKKTSPPSFCRIAVAPMIDWTDRHCRFFHRLLAPHALLYTEMITSSAILHGNRDRLLGFSPRNILSPFSLAALILKTLPYAQRLPKILAMMPSISIADAPASACKKEASGRA